MINVLLLITVTLFFGKVAVKLGLSEVIGHRSITCWHCLGHELFKRRS